MSEQRENKTIEIKNGSFIDKMTDMVRSKSGEGTRKGSEDPYAFRAQRGREGGRIAYPNVGLLDRPLDMPGAVRKGLIAFLAAAALIGGVFLFRYFDVMVNAPAREEAQVIENTTRTVAYNLPVLLDLMPESDTAMLDQLKASGDTLFERTPIGTNANGGFQVVRLPEGVSLADAAALFLTGLEKVSASSASHLLNGAWDLTVTRETPYNLFLRYADFSSGSIENAIQNALVAEGLETQDGVESDVDDSGNTYVTGTVEEGSYTWRISVISLSEVYDIKGLPDDALYVGIRMTKNAE